MTRMTALVTGDVQGVGFRWWTRSQLQRLGLEGSATNLPDGRVRVVVEGPRADVEKLAELLDEEPSTAARPGQVEVVVTEWGAD